MWSPGDTLLPIMTRPVAMVFYYETPFEDELVQNNFKTTEDVVLPTWVILTTASKRYM